MHFTQKEFSAHPDLSCKSTFTHDHNALPSTREPSPAPAPFLDRSDMPSTREPSPEPYWNNDNLYKWNDPSVQALWNASRDDYVARHSLARRSSREPPARRREDVNPPAQCYQTVLVIPHNQPVLFVGQDGNVILPTNTVQVAQPYPFPAADVAATQEAEQEQPPIVTKSSGKNK